MVSELSSVIPTCGLAVDSTTSVKNYSANIWGLYDICRRLKGDTMKKLLLLLIPIFAIFVLSGCGCHGKAITSIWIYADKFEKEKEIVKLPDINAISEVGIGETIIFTSMQKTIPILILNENITHIGKYCDYPVNITAKKGPYRLSRKNEEGQLFFGENNNITIEVSKAIRDLDKSLSWSSAESGIYIPNDKLKPAGIFWAESVYPEYFNMEPISRPNFKISKEIEWVADSTEFKRELVYNGKSGNIIFIIYREFVDNMARPAFSTEIKYDLSDTKKIGYKNARFEVIDATNMAIRYKVLKHLK